MTVLEVLGPYAEERGGYLVTWYPLCGGSSHPATGCCYSEMFVVCWRCTLDLCRWLERWTCGKGARRGLLFYEHASWPVWTLAGTYEAFCSGMRALHTRNKAMKQETIAVPVELVRELKELVELWSGRKTWDSLEKRIGHTILHELPDPPKPDVVEECERARLNSYSRGPMAGDYNRHAMRTALRRYRELRGLPPDPELED